MSASRPFFGGDPFCLYKTNDFEYMGLFFSCTFAQQKIFIPFHLRIKSYKKELWNNFRATVCELFSALRINKMLKKRKTMDGSFSCM